MTNSRKDKIDEHEWESLTGSLSHNEVKHKRIFTKLQGFDWKIQLQKAELKKCYRFRRNLKINPDTRMLHPEEAKLIDQDWSKLPKQCEEKIHKDYEMYLRKIAVPVVINPKRLNRL